MKKNVLYGIKVKRKKFYSDDNDTITMQLLEYGTVEADLFSGFFDYFLCSNQSIFNILECKIISRIYELNPVLIDKNFHTKLEN